MSAVSVIFFLGVMNMQTRDKRRISSNGVGAEIVSLLLVLLYAAWTQWWFGAIQTDEGGFGRTRCAHVSLLQQKQQHCTLNKQIICNTYSACILN